MAATEIEKLERRYAENPQGLTFAPLAEVHRKNGEVARALELLRAGLELHPNYIPASIVLGRCHWDLGDLPAAEAAFSHVLRLDDENVIALKSLADINERLERFGEAQRWLNRLISVDRSNEEARQQLARLESSKQQPSVQVSAPRREPEPVPAVEPKAAPVAERIPEITPPPVATPAPEARAPDPAPAPAPASQSPANLDLTAAIAEPKSSELDFIDTSAGPAPSSSSEPPTGSQPQTDPAEPSSPPEEPAPLAGLISGEFVPPQGGVYKLHPELTQDFVPDESTADQLEVETAEEVELHSSGASEFRVPNAAEEFMDAASAGPTRAQDLDLPDLSPHELPAEPEPRAKADPPTAPEPVRAEPPSRTPLMTKAGPPAEPQSPEVGHPEPPEPRSAPPPELDQPPRRSYSVRDTKGQSVAAFFQHLLSARPGGSAGSATPTPAAEMPSPPAAPPADDTVSFDDFFGTAASASGSTPVAKQDADPSKDDLDQFQSWLQNLKR